MNASRGHLTSGYSGKNVTKKQADVTPEHGRYVPVVCAISVSEIRVSVPPVASPSECPVAAIWGQKRQRLRLPHVRLRLPHVWLRLHHEHLNDVFHVGMGIF